MARGAKLGIAAALVAVIAGIGGAYRTVSASHQAETREIVISVPGIPGPYCAYGVEKRLKELGGVRRVEVLWEEEIIRAYFDEGVEIPREQIVEAMTKADYPYDYTIERP